VYLDYKTIDFVIEDEEELFSFIHLLNVAWTVKFLSMAYFNLGIKKLEEV